MLLHLRSYALALMTLCLWCTEMAYLLIISTLWKMLKFCIFEGFSAFRGKYSILAHRRNDKMSILIIQVSQARLFGR